MRWLFGNTLVANKQHTAGSLAVALDAALDGPEHIICSGVSSITEAKQGDITFMVDAKYAKCWATSDATIGIVKVDIDVQGHDASSRALLRVDRPDLAMAKVLELFNTEEETAQEGIHETAVIDSSATLGHGVCIGPYVVIEQNVVIGDNVVIECHTKVARNCTIGAHTILRAGVVLEYGSVLGEHCILNAHVTIGTDGFGYTPSSDMSSLVKIHHIGNVTLGDRIEIGSNSCVDRGKFGSTSIGNGTKLDNLVQIGHNVTIGENCVIASGSGLAGSVRVGNWVQIAAHVGIAPHCIVGDGAKIGAKSGLMHDIPAGEEWLGYPAGKLRDVLRQWACTRKLPRSIADFGKSNSCKDQ
jgi:UDP-3-O-[3-hydroxymyristoyl] glucosamine N-acyltransferase